MGGQGQEQLNQKLPLELHPTEEQLPAGVLIMGEAAPGSSTSSTSACQCKTPGHLALLTHCESKLPLCTENHCGDQGHCPQGHLACFHPCQAGGRSLNGAGAAQGSAWASATAPGAEMLSQGKSKPDRKSALKTDPKIKKAQISIDLLCHITRKGTLILTHLLL